MKLPTAKAGLEIQAPFLPMSNTMLPNLLCIYLQLSRGKGIVDRHPTSCKLSAFSYSSSGGFYSDSKIYLVQKLRKTQRVNLGDRSAKLLVETPNTILHKQLALRL